MQAKKEAKEGISSAKKFEKLSPITKNILMMFTILPGMSEDEIEELAPTENALSLLEITSGAMVRETLHEFMRQKGCMVHLQLG